MQLQLKPASKNLVFQNLSQWAKICRFGTLYMLKNLFSPKFEIGSYFLKSIKKFLYNWGNKTSKHSGSSLATLKPYHSNFISWMPPIKPVFYMVFITSLFISLEPTANFGNHRNLPVIAWFSDIQGHLWSLWERSEGAANSLGCLRIRVLL